MACAPTSNSSRARSSASPTIWVAGSAASSGRTFRASPRLSWRAHRVLRTNIQTARAMRAPGHPQNAILTEQAIDDLAARLNINPMTLRLANLPPNDAADAKANPRTYLGQRATIYRTEIEIIRKMC